MSLPPQHKVSSDKSSKHSAAAMKEPLQHPGEVYYGMGPPVVEPGHSDSGSTSGVYNQEKGPQSRLQYQQAAPVKWMHQEPIQPSGWSQEVSVPGWGQNFVPYMGGPNIRGQMAFHKGGQNVGALQMGGENQQTGSVEAYRESPQAQTQAQARGLEWEQHAATAAMHQAQLQAYQQGHKGVDIQGQPHAPPQAMPGSVLQPFQATFKTAKQQFPSGYYPVFQGHKAIPSLGYSEQPKTQQQLLHQMQQQQMHHHQQQQLRQQHHHQLQQQHLQQQQHQMQQRQIHQQQQLQQMQQQYHQHQLQERRQQIHQMQQQLQPQPNVSQPEVSQLQVHQKQLHTQNFMAYEPAEPCPSDPSVSNLGQQQEAEIQADDPPASSIPCSEKVSSDPMQSENAAVVVPRRSRRLSREGLSPVAPPPTIPCSQASKETPPSQNGVAEAEAVRTGEAQVTTGGVIHSTRRRRRASKEINLETLAQKASEMESLPAKVVKQEDGPQGRQAGMVPLVIPVSVPVCGSQTDPLRAWPQEQGGPSEEQPNQPNHKPSVIVARRRSLRSSMSESFGQDGETCPGQDEEGKSKSKRRPRPEPLFIPPPKPSTFIAPSVYSSITSYQSHLRSPVRLPDNPLTLPPYTPPPILSPVREGSGLYFSTFLSNIAASNQSLPPPATPKSASRSLLRSSSSDITPPVLPLITDATPVSLEPRINIGQQYQAEVPELRERCAAQVDQHKADLVWLPMDESQLKHGDQDRTKDMMNLACSSVFRGGGTNQELVLHCLHQYGGNILETLNCLMLEDTIIPKDHHLTDYHYSGSDRWTAAEKCYFNKGISAYRKDFFRVQKLVRTKTVAQCVEFYYTYKKQVKIGRNGTLTYGPPDSFMDKGSEAVVDIKSSQRSKMNQGEGERGDKLEQDLFDQGQDESLARVAQSLQAHDYAATVLVLQEKDVGNRQIYTQSILPPGSGKPVPEPAGKKSRAPPKASQDPEGVFPCKKCSRVFYKVKSRSAHMKSHAEQEKKAAAQRQREEEEEVRKAAAAEAQVKKAAVAAAMAAGAQAGNGSGGTEQAEVSSQGESSEGEDEDDDDWQ